MSDDTTIAITSCNRHDLLHTTLASLRAFNTDRATGEIIVIEDGDADPSDLCRRFGAKLLRVGQRIGQLAAIDLLYSYVNTPYIFHCEDDWEFFRSGFVERSREILRTDLSAVCVWLRAWDDTNGHPLSFASSCRTFGVLSSDHVYADVEWGGFTWNPGLRRLSDYMRVGPFSRFKPRPHLSAEADIAARYKALGFRAVILDETGYVRHLGWDRHVA